MNFKTFALILSVLISHNLLAKGWSTQAIKLGHEYQHPIHDGAVSSIWGNLMPMVSAKLGGHNGITIRSRYIRSRHFKSGHIEFIESWPEDLVYQRLPVVIFNPGVFSPLWGDQTTDMIKRLSELGYRVIAFANPLDKDFVTLNPNFEVGNIYLQAQAIYEATQAIIGDYRRGGLMKGDPRFVGVSYGTFLTTLIAALDLKANNPIGVRDVTLFSPPFVLTESIGLLDKLIINTRKNGFELSSWRVLKGIWRILWLRGLSRREATDSRLSIEARGILGEMVFRSGMARALKELDKLTGKVGVPKKRKARRQWRDSLLFSEIFSKYSPEFASSFTGSSGEQLTTWLDQLRAHDIPIRVLSSKDDFINAQIPVESFGEDEIIVLEAGGHYGYRSLDWFSDLVNISF